MVKLINKADDEILNPWWRYTWNKDGSLSSVDRHESGRTEAGKFVGFVQAATKAEATARAQKLIQSYYSRLSRGRAYNANHKAAALASGLCIKCGERPMGASLKCQKCAEQAASYARRLRAGGETKTRAPAPRSDIERVALMVRENERSRSAQAQRRERARGVFGNTYAAYKTAASLPFARQCLATYDQLAHPTVGNPRFRNWLVAQIRDMEADLAKCRKREQAELMGSGSSASVAAE